jgi:hypothetical protein
MRRGTLVKTTCLLCLLLWCTLTVDSVSTCPAAAAPALNTKEELMGEKNPDTKSGGDIEDTASPDRASVAWRERHRNKWAAMLNGKQQGAEYDEVKWLVFSPDSRHLAYFGRTGKKWAAIVDGQRDKTEYDNLDGVTFTEDGLHYAYAAMRAKKWLIVRDGIESPIFDDVGKPHFSSTGQRLVYTVKQGDSWRVLDEGKESSPMTEYEFLGFTPKLEKVIAIGYEHAGVRLIIDQQRGPVFDTFAPPVFVGPNDDHFVYAGSNVRRYAVKEEHGAGRIVIDGKEGREYEAAPIQSTGKMLLSALAGQFKVLQNGVVDRLESRWHGVSSPAISVDGRHVAYSVRRADKDYVVVADGQEGPSFEAIPCGPAYSPEGKLSYVGFTAGKLVILSEGNRVSELPWLSESWRDSDHCADFRLWEAGHSTFILEQGWSGFGLHGQYSFVTGGLSVEEQPRKPIKRQLVINGKQGKVHESRSLNVIAPRIAGSEIHVVYEVRGDKAHNDGSFVVIDGEEGKLFDGIAPRTTRISDDQTVTYIALSGRKFLRVTHPPQ